MNTAKPKAAKPAAIVPPTFTGDRRPNVPNPPPLPDLVQPTPKIPEEFRLMPAEELAKLEILPKFRLYSLTQGCYLTKYTPVGTSYHYDGTIRVQREGTNTIASGDLYYHKPFQPWPFPIHTPPVVAIAPGAPVLHSLNPFLFLGEPNPANGIPRFARSNYRYYLRITQILEWISFSKTFTLGFEMHRFNGSAATPMWTNEGLVTAEMTFSAAPAGYPAGADYLTGQVKNGNGALLGTLAMGWVSKYYRKATVEIDRVADAEAPLNSGAGHTWQTIFDEVGWDMTVAESNTNLAEPSGDSWSDGEMHAAMLAQRDSANLDTSWRYHILAVNRLDSTERGIMYDAYGGDSNNIPREGLGISSHWMIPNANPWGKVKGQRFGAATAPYFRTALHELGHAMGLYHNTIDMGFMNTTPDIAAAAVAPVQFPDNVKWMYASDDLKRLRHMPDPFVRPGGIPFGAGYPAQPISPDDEMTEATGLTMTVAPVMDVLPIGAPVRFELSLTNYSDALLPAPASLKMKNGFISGTVTDPSGYVRSFRSMVMCVDDEPVVYMNPGASLTESMTLLRGADGALFPLAGSYTVEVTASWELDDSHVGVSATTSVFVMQAQTESHARAAMTVLSTPDTLLSLVVTGDHLTVGNAAIEVALADKTLRPHFAYMEAKRLAKPFMKRKAKPDAADALINKNTVMSAAEKRKAATMLKTAKV